MLVPRRFRISKPKILGYLDELATIEDQGLSLYLPCGISPATVRKHLALFAPLAEIEGISEIIVNSKTGAVLFWGQQRKCLVQPPFPLREDHTTNGYDTEPLRSILSTDYKIAIILIRLGAYSIGVFRGMDLIDSKTGTGLVHSRHKKGGSSQARFARHREKQIEYFLDRICGHIRDNLEPQAQLLDYLVYGGAKTTILLLRKKCPFLQQFDDRNLPMLLEVAEPRKTVLEEAINNVCSSTVIEWCENG